MKTLRLPFYFLLCLSLLTFAACGDDDDGPQASENELRYDTGAFSAPNSPIKTFATYFPASEVRPFRGRTLEGVSFILQAIPDSTTVVIYEEGPTDEAPGNEIYRRNITNRINVSGNDFIDHFVSGRDPIVLGDDGIWIGIEVFQDNLNNSGTSVGCDNGANFNINGDRMQLTNGDWTNFEDFSTTETVNWNIRGLVSAQ